LLKFGKLAERLSRAKDRKKPETFDFLGFTHICSKTRNGCFKILRKTIAKKARAKLKDIKEQFKRRMHDGLVEQVKWIKAVLSGYYNYYAVHDNLPGLVSFRYHVGKMWFKALRRRSQKSKLTWAIFNKDMNPNMPIPKVRHPYPNVRFDAKHS
jgi:hypothetical protein